MCDLNEYQWLRSKRIYSTDLEWLATQVEGYTYAIHQLMNDRDDYISKSSVVDREDAAIVVKAYDLAISQLAEKRAGTNRALGREVKCQLQSRLQQFEMGWISDEVCRP